MMSFELPAPRAGGSPVQNSITAAQDHVLGQAFPHGHQNSCLGSLPGQLFCLSIQVFDLLLELLIQRLQGGSPLGCIASQ
jgi:hypothetical protein